MGAVLERPVCERLFGVTSPRAGEEGWVAPWPGVCGAFDLTDAGGEVLLGAFEGCDMESTLVRPRREQDGGCVAECLADIAGRGPGRCVLKAREAVVWARGYTAGN